VAAAVANDWWQQQSQMLRVVCSHQHCWGIHRLSEHTIFEHKYLHAPYYCCLCACCRYCCSWYHVGQNHHHTAAMLQSKTSSQQQQQIAHAQRQLQQQLLLKAQQGTLTPSRAADELLQSYSSNTHSDKASSWGSEPGGLHALPPLQPMASSSSSSAAAPLSGSSSSSEEDLPGFQAEFDSDSAACTPTYSGDEACLGMLLGTNFGL
jgi:hypothetical protein